MTDVATGMPDLMHKDYVTPLLPYFDLYVSSLSCGYKKLNPKGLRDISEHFGCDRPDAKIQTVPLASVMEKLQQTIRVDFQNRCMSKEFL